jgi:threonine/homoserine efflux transporter RhtA
MMQANLLALAAIALWSLLAWLGLQLAHVPPFLLTGIALLVGSLIAVPLAWQCGRLDLSSWKMPWAHLLAAGMGFVRGLASRF